MNDLIKQYDEVRKVSTGEGDDYTQDVYQIRHILKTITD